MQGLDRQIEAAIEAIRFLRRENRFTDFDTVRNNAVISISREAYEQACRRFSIDYLAHLNHTRKRNDVLICNVTVDRVRE